MLRKSGYIALIAMASSMAMPTAPKADAGLVIEAVQQGRYAVMAGSSLRSTLEGWGRSAGWSVVWDQESDYRIRASAVFPGDFEAAVVNLLDSIHLDHPELSVVLYRGNFVLHVENRYSTGD